MRNTLYGDVDPDRRTVAHSAPVLVPVINTPAGRRQSTKRLAQADAGLPVKPQASNQVVMLAACN